MRKEIILSSNEKTKLVTVEGYACTLCNKFWGEYRTGAANCCANTSICEDCGGQIDALYYTYCSACRDKRKTLRFEKLYAEKAVDWDGKTPLYSELYDDYIMRDLEDWVECRFEDFEKEQPLTKELIEMWQLRLCTPNNGRTFDLNEFLCDDLFEDDTLDSEEVEKFVNDFIARHAPLSWSGDGYPVTVESICRALGVAE